MDSIRFGSDFITILPSVIPQGVYNTHSASVLNSSLCIRFSYRLLINFSFWLGLQFWFFLCNIFCKILFRLSLNIVVRFRRSVHLYILISHRFLLFNNILYLYSVRSRLRSRPRAPASPLYSTQPSTSISAELRL